MTTRQLSGLNEIRCGQRCSESPGSSRRSFHVSVEVVRLTHCIEESSYPIRSSSSVVPKESARIRRSYNFGRRKTSSPLVISHTRIVFVPAVTTNDETLLHSMTY